MFVIAFIGSRGEEMLYFPPFCKLIIISYHFAYLQRFQFMATALSHLRHCRIWPPRGQAIKE